MGFVDGMSLYRGYFAHANVDPSGLEHAPDVGDDDVALKNCVSHSFRRDFELPNALKRFFSLIGLPSQNVDGRFYARRKDCRRCCGDGTWKRSVSGSIGASLYVKGVTGEKDLGWVKFQYGLYIRGGGAGSLSFSYDGCKDKLSGGGCFSIFVEGGIIGEADIKGWWVRGGVGIRGGINISGSVCLSCDGKLCKVKLTSCISARARFWAFARWRKRKWEYVYERSAEACLSKTIYSFSL